MKKVLIKIKGTQSDGQDNAVIELDTEGILKVLPDGFALKYQENQTIEGGNVKTMLTVKGNDTVILERSGDLSSRLVITEGVRNNCPYAIPQGSLTLGIYGKEVKYDLNECGGTVKMVYTLDTNLQMLSENTVEITVEERK